MPQAEQAGADAGPQQVEDVLHARLPVGAQSPQVDQSVRAGAVSGTGQPSWLRVWIAMSGREALHVGQRGPGPGMFSQ